MSLDSTRGRVLAVDLGRVRVGLAISDEDRSLASPLPPLSGGDTKRLVCQLADLCSARDVRLVLIGLPLDMNGQAGPAAQKAARFAQAFVNHTKLEVELVDERLSTVEAHKRLDAGGKARGKARSKDIDGAAAALLLQAHLDQA